MGLLLTHGERAGQSPAQGRPTSAGTGEACDGGCFALEIIFQSTEVIRIYCALVSLNPLSST